MIIEFVSEVSNLAWRVSQSQNGSAIFTLTKWSPMFGSVVFDHQWCILIVMSVKSSFYNEYDIKNNEKHVLWAQRSFQNHHQTFHDRCPEKIGPLPKKSDHWFTRTCPENIRPAPTWWTDQLSEFTHSPNAWREIMLWQICFHDLGAIFSLWKLACSELFYSHFFVLCDWLILEIFGISWDLH